MEENSILVVQESAGSLNNALLLQVSNISALFICNGFVQLWDRKSVSFSCSVCVCVWRGGCGGFSL